MDELVQLVSQKTGLSPDVARTAVETVVGYLKDKLPAPVANQVEALLKGGQAGKGLGGIADSLGGMRKGK